MTGKVLVVGGICESQQVLADLLNVGVPLTSVIEVDERSDFRYLADPDVGIVIILSSRSTHAEGRELVRSARATRDELKVLTYDPQLFCEGVAGVLITNSRVRSGRNQLVHEVVDTLTHPSQLAN